MGPVKCNLAAAPEQAEGDRQIETVGVVFQIRRSSLAKCTGATGHDMLCSSCF